MPAPLTTHENDYDDDDDDDDRLATSWGFESTDFIDQKTL